MLLQLYSLGVPHPDTGVLAVHVVASDTEMDQVDDHKAMDDDACRRVAEALMFATALNHLKATNQVHSHSSVLHVCCFCARTLTVKMAVERRVAPSSVCCCESPAQVGLA